jgi:guanylate kinase
MRRLLNRSTETKEGALKRLERYDMELEASNLFDIVIENDILKNSLEEIKSIIKNDNLFN